MYIILKHQITYDDLSEDFHDRQRADHLKLYHVKRLRRLGFNVEVTEMRLGA